MDTLFVMLLEHGPMKLLLRAMKFFQKVLIKKMKSCVMRKDIPYNDYFQYFGPEYVLDVPSSNMENMNSKQYLEKVTYERSHIDYFNVYILILKVSRFLKT